MGLFSVSQSLGFAGKIFDSKISTEPMIELPSFKPLCSFSEQNDLPRCKPEQEGVPSSLIRDFLKALAEDRTLNMHSVTVVRNGKILCEVAFGAQRLDVWKYTFSACKSVTALAIGFLIDDGILGLKDRVVDIFPKEAGAMGKLKFKDLTVEDLLTMRSGVFFTELDSVVEEDWLRGFFDAPTKGEPGKTFRYNSMNTYVLAAIVTAKTGKTLSAFLRERLFQPLGICDESWFWEPCPRGIEKGGWGLYIRPDDFAKIATLVMQKGIWNGTRLLSEEYITAATSAQVEVDTESTLFDYGYQVWIGKQTDTFLFNGLFGQNVLGFRRNGIIVLCNAGNNELFQQSNFFKYVIEFFDRDFEGACEPNRKANQALDRYVQALSSYSQKTPLNARLSPFSHAQKRKKKRAFRSLIGQRYVHFDGYEKSVGLLPLILQAVENRYTEGFAGISFTQENGIPQLIYEENGSTVTIQLGEEKPQVQTLTIGDIPFSVAVTARMTRDEDATRVLVIRIDFLEYPSSRVIKLFFIDKDTVFMRNEELPGKALARSAVKLVVDELPDKGLVSGVMDRIGVDYFEFKAERAFSSELLLKRENPQKTE